MKLAIPFTLEKNYNTYADEFNIMYKKTATLEKLIAFCEMYPNNRINIEFEDDIELDHLKVIHKIHNDIAVQLQPPQMNQVMNIKEIGVKFFFDYSLPCYSLALLDSFLAVGVSDIYISDYLCYNMELVKKQCEEAGVQIRLILNRIPQFSPNRGMDVRAPIFNPRDIEQLEEYIDVFEFDCGSPYDWHKFAVYYKTWFERRDWYGDLSEINLDLDIPIEVQDIVPGFLDRKLNCGRQCSLGHPCHRCEDWYELNNDLFNENVIVKRGNLK